MVGEATAAELGLREAARPPSLEEALLLGRFGRYVRYRLRYLVLLTLLSTLLHGIEVDLLVAAYPLDALLPLVAYRAAAAAVIPWWWGALEALRSEVREQARARKYRRAADRIEAWLGAALWLGMAVCALTLGWLWASPTRGRHPNLYDIYALCCALRLSVDLTVRTYHAGRFAVGRVYRPLWSVALPTLFEGSSLVLLWFWVGLGIWALPAALLLGTALRGALTLFFSHRAYQGSRLGKVSFARAFRSPLAVGRVSARAGARFALANSVSQLDSLLILVLVTQPERPGATVFALLYYVLSPLMGTAHKWCRVFYFDLQRLSDTLHGFMRVRLERSLRALAWLSGLAVAGLTVLLSATLLRIDVGWAPLSLAPLFVARSHFSLVQLQAFSYHRTRPLLWLAGSLLLAVFVLSRTHAPAALVVLDVSFVLGISTWLASRRIEGRTRDRSGERLGWFAFLRQLSRRLTPVRVAIMQVDRGLCRVRDVERVLRARFPEASFCSMGRAALCMSLPSGGPTPYAEIHAESGGVLARLHLLEAASGPEARQQLREQKLWPTQPQLAHAPREASALRSACLELGGHVLAVDGERQTLHVARDAGERVEAREALEALGRECAGGLSPPARPAVVVCAYAPGGELQWAFIWPHGRREVLPLREEIRARSACDS